MNVGKIVLTGLYKRINSYVRYLLLRSEFRRNDEIIANKSPHTQ